MNNIKIQEINDIFNDKNEKNHLIKIFNGILKAYRDLGLLNNLKYHQKLDELNALDLFSLNYFDLKKIYFNNLYINDKSLFGLIFDSDIFEILSSLFYKDINKILINSYEKYINILIFLMKKYRYYEIKMLKNDQKINTSLGLIFLKYYEKIKNLYHHYLIDKNNFELINLTGKSNFYNDIPYEIEVLLGHNLEINKSFINFSNLATNTFKLLTQYLIRINHEINDLFIDLNNYLNINEFKVNKLDFINEININDKLDLNNFNLIKKSLQNNLNLFIKFIDDSIKELESLELNIDSNLSKEEIFKKINYIYKKSGII